MAGQNSWQIRAAGRTGRPVRKRGWRKKVAGWTWRLARQGSWQNRAAGMTWRQSELHRAGWLVGVWEGSRRGGIVGKGMGMGGE